MHHIQLHDTGKKSERAVRELDTINEELGKLHFDSTILRDNAELILKDNARIMEKYNNTDT